MTRNESDLQKLLKYHIIEKNIIEKTNVVNMTAPSMINEGTLLPVERCEESKIG